MPWCRNVGVVSSSNGWPGQEDTKNAWGFSLYDEELNQPSPVTGLFFWWDAGISGIQGRGNWLTKQHQGGWTLPNITSAYWALRQSCLGHWKREILCQLLVLEKVGGECWTRDSSDFCGLVQGWDLSIVRVHGLWVIPVCLWWVTKRSSAIGRHLTSVYSPVENL